MKYRRSGRFQNQLQYPAERNDIILFEILCAVKGHMLGHMSKTLLIIIFNY
jgi:hypothetical protein